MVVRSDANSAINQLRPTSSCRVLSLRCCRVIACENDDNHSKISVKRPHIRPSVCSKYLSVCVMQRIWTWDIRTAPDMPISFTYTLQFRHLVTLGPFWNSSFTGISSVQFTGKNAENRSSEGDLSLNLGKCSKTLPNGSSSLVSSGSVNKHKTQAFCHGWWRHHLLMKSYKKQK